MKDVCDGKYVGEMTRREVIEQFEYRITIHESYAGLVLEDERYLSYGSYEFHMWAINGYEQAIHYLKLPQLQDVITRALKILMRIRRK